MEQRIKLAIVTGASSGVGAATASLLVKHGYRVVMIARSADRLHALAGSLGVLAIAAPANAASETEMAPIATRILAEHGAPDLIVNSAGAGRWQRIEDTTEADAREMMDAPYMAAFVTTRVFLPAMLERGSGVILPREDADGLAIETVNVDQVNVKVSRVNDRALAFKSITQGVESQQGRYSYVYGDENPSDLASEVWSGTMDIQNLKNAPVVTVFPLPDVIGTLEPGAYYIELTDAIEPRPTATTRPNWNARRRVRRP